MDFRIINHLLKELNTKVIFHPIKIYLKSTDEGEKILDTKKTYNQMLLHPAYARCDKSSNSGGGPVWVPPMVMTFAAGPCCGVDWLITTSFWAATAAAPDWGSILMSPCWEDPPTLER